MIKLVKLLREAYISEDMIKQLALEMGETIKEFLGSGQNGKAYTTASGKVLKLTEDPAEVALATRLRKKRLYKHIINVYDIRPIENLAGSYLILMDKVDTFKKAEQSQWDAVRRNYLNNKNSDKKFLEWVEYQPEQTASRTIDLEFIKKITQQRTGLLRDFSELRIVYEEAHGGNMGWNKFGNLVHFDSWQEEHYTQSYDWHKTKTAPEKSDREIAEIPYEKGLNKPLQSFKNRNK